MRRPLLVFLMVWKIFIYIIEQFYYIVEKIVARVHDQLFNHYIKIVNIFYCLQNFKNYTFSIPILVVTSLDLVVFLQLLRSAPSPGGCAYYLQVSVPTRCNKQTVQKIIT
jgi:hypothetical protein